MIRHLLFNIVQVLVVMGFAPLLLEAENGTRSWAA